MFCPRCGVQNDDNNFKCTGCGTVLHPAPRAVPVAAEDLLAQLIPYKNSKAVISYYLAVFAIIPFVGLFLGIPAFFLGLQGLRFANQHPEARGKIHAWVGIVAGGLFGFGYLILSVLVIVAAMRNG